MVDLSGVTNVIAANATLLGGVLMGLGFVLVFLGKIAPRFIMALGALAAVVVASIVWEKRHDLVLFGASLIAILLASSLVALSVQIAALARGFPLFLAAWFLLLYSSMGFEPLTSAAGLSVLAVAAVFTSWATSRLTRRLRKTTPS